MILKFLLKSSQFPWLAKSKTNYFDTIKPEILHFLPNWDWKIGISSLKIFPVSFDVYPELRAFTLYQTQI